MLRSMTKTNAQLTTGFLKSQYRTNVGQLIGGELSSVFIPPCTRCLRQVSAYIVKTRRPVSSFLALLVYSSTEVDFSHDIKAILDATVLTHTSWNGLGILNMIFTFCNFNNVSWVEIYNYTLFDKTITTWKKIIDFLAEYQKKGNPDQTVPWARVIDDAYFTKFGPQDHPLFASLVLVSLERIQNEAVGIENSVWAQRHIRVVELCRNASTKLADLLSCTATTITAGSREATTIAEIFNVSDVPSRA
ncbi:unnamed protein product [Arctia plantaginis]|uniref:Uncharacterized protein n=1 Tax=Arctia plantaginis TaxID=874455 RepID=A0A8S0Z4J3_ARCPL|nr:unnamed protein product [Arctia plantaginis]